MPQPTGPLVEPARSGPLTVGTYLGSWLDHARARVRANTHDGYEALIRLHASPHLGPVLLTDLHPLLIQRLYTDLLAKGLSGGTVLNLRLVLTQALAQAVRWGLIGANPAGGAQPPRPTRPQITLVDPSLAERILQAVKGTPFEVPPAVAIATGMRRGEVLALRWSALDRDLSVPTVRRSLQCGGVRLCFEEPKTRRSRRAVALPAFLIPYLQNQRTAQAARRDTSCSWVDLDLVIDSGAGSPVNPDTLSSAWPRFLKRSGLP